MMLALSKKYETDGPDGSAALRVQKFNFGDQTPTHTPSKSKLTESTLHPVYSLNLVGQV